jgi:hypothetical protein
MRLNLTRRQKIKRGDKWGCPALYRNKEDVQWEDVDLEWIGRTAASFNGISFVRLIEEKKLVETSVTHEEIT